MFIKHSLSMYATCRAIVFKHFMYLNFNFVVVCVCIRCYSLPFVTTSKVLFFI
jgi:hypothetical protein